LASLKPQAIKVSSLVSKFGRPMEEPDPAHLRVAIFCATVAARCADIVPVSRRAMRFLQQTVR